MINKLNQNHSLGHFESCTFDKREIILSNGKFFRTGMNVQSDYFEGSKEITFLYEAKKTQSPSSQNTVNNNDCYAYLNGDQSNPYHLSVLIPVEEADTGSFNAS
jgi:hypothetical protein